MSLALGVGAAHARAAMGLFKRLPAIAVFAASLLYSANAGAACLDAPDLAAYQTATPADFAAGPTRTVPASCPDSTCWTTASAVAIAMLVALVVPIMLLRSAQARAEEDV